MAADPVIVLFKDTYFLFVTGSTEYWYSPDLVNWTLIPETVSQLPVTVNHKNDRPTAPAATVIDDALIYMPSTSKKGLFYRSTDPKSGKWELVGEGLSGWDPALLYDEDGRLYYYRGCSNNAPIQGMELDKASFQPKGPNWVNLFSMNGEEHGWERPGDQHELPRAGWMEGAWMTKHAGTYYLQYAAPGTEFKCYADGVYTSKNPLGPFKYQPYSPFSHKPGGFIGGAGHGATFQDKHGNYWRVVTMVVSVLDMFERRVGIFPAGFDKDGVMYADTLLGDFPQTMPAAKRDPLADNLPQWMLLSYGKRAGASSSTAAHEAESAFDEDVKTWWCAETADKGEWLKVDLGAACTVHAIQVNFAEHDAKLFGRDRPICHQYIVEYSADNDHWKRLVDKSRNEKDVPHDYIHLPRPVVARFIRLTNVHTPGDGRFAVRDLRLFGNGSGEAPQEVDGLTVNRDPEDGRTARIAWNKSKDAAGYVIRYGISPAKLYSQYQVMGKNELQINSLNKNVVYHFAVDVFNENGYRKGTRIIKSE